MPKKKLLKQIRTIANQMPAQFVDGTITLKGSEIAAKKDIDGFPIDPEKYYKVNCNCNVNHYKRIKKIFGKLGHNGVDEYIHNVFTLNAESITQHSQMLSGMPSMPTL